MEYYLFHTDQLDNNVFLKITLHHIGSLPPKYSESIIPVQFFQKKSPHMVNHTQANIRTTYTSYGGDVPSFGILAHGLQKQGAGVSFRTDLSATGVGNRYPRREEMSKSSTREKLRKLRTALSKKADQIIRALAAAMVA
jgi:hypothetical protein